MSDNIEDFELEDGRTIKVKFTYKVNGLPVKDLDAAVDQWIAIHTQS